MTHAADDEAGEAPSGAGTAPLLEDEAGRATTANALAQAAADLLASHNATAPLSRSRTTFPLPDQDQLRLELETALARAGKLASSLENRVELLLHACQASQMAVPGVETWEYRHALSPKAKQIIAALQGRLEVQPLLAKQVQVAIFRYAEASSLVKDVREAMREGRIEKRHLETLKLKFFFLANFHREFKQDALLCQIFPQPSPESLAVLEAEADAEAMAASRPAPEPEPAPAAKPARQPAPATDKLSRYRVAREAAAAKAEALLLAVTPSVARCQHLLALAKKGDGKFGWLNPFDAKERQLAGKLKERPVLLLQLQEAIQLVELLGEHLERVKAGARFEGLQETHARLVALHGVWKQQPLLKDLLPGLPE